MNFNLDEQFFNYDDDILNGDNSIKPLNGKYYFQKANQPYTYFLYNNNPYANNYVGADWYYNLGRNIAKSLFGGKNGAYNVNVYPLQNNLYNHNYSQGANYMHENNFYYDEKNNCVVIGNNQQTNNYDGEAGKYIKIDVGGKLSVLVMV